MHANTQESRISLFSMFISGCTKLHREFISVGEKLIHTQRKLAVASFANLRHSQIHRGKPRPSSTKDEIFKQIELQLSKQTHRRVSAAHQEWLTTDKRLWLDVASVAQQGFLVGRYECVGMGVDGWWA